MSFTRTGRKLSDSRRQNYRMRKGKVCGRPLFLWRDWSDLLPSLPASALKGEEIDLSSQKKAGNVESVQCPPLVSDYIWMGIRMELSHQIYQPHCSLSTWFKGSSRTTILKKKKRGLLSHGDSVCQATVCSHVAFSTAASGSTDGCVLTGLSAAWIFHGINMVKCSIMAPRVSPLFHVKAASQLPPSRLPVAVTCAFPSKKRYG